MATVEFDLQHVVGATRASTCPACGGAIRVGNSVTWHAFHRNPVHVECETLLTPAQQQRLRDERKKCNPRVDG